MSVLTKKAIKNSFLELIEKKPIDQLTIRDPNSWRNTQQTWDAQRVLDQHRNIWGFTYDG